MDKLNFRVLIVDDTRAVHAFVKDLFSKVPGVETKSVFNGLEAVELLKKDKNFDLVLLDWEMPIMTGPEAFDKIKDVSIPVMMMTTKNDVEDLNMMFEKGVSEYLMKPFTLDILLQKIEAATGRGFSNVA